MKKNHNVTLILGIIITSIVFLFFIIGFFYTPYDPNEMMVGPKCTPPSFKHFMGTDNFGRDIFSRILEGSRSTTIIALCTVLLGSVIGTLIGALTGYFGGFIDTALMHINDSLTAIPSMLIALVIVGILGGGKYNIILALGILFIPSYARVTRTCFASLKDAQYVQNAKLMGVKTPRILFMHILPNTLSVILPTLTIGFSNAVLSEASMSYLGIGVKPPEASLGYMLSEAQSILKIAPWYALNTGFVIVLIVFGVGLLGDGLSKQNNGEY